MERNLAIKGEFAKNLCNMPDEDIGAMMKTLFRAFLTGEKQDFGGNERFLYECLYEYMLQDLDRQEKRRQHAVKAINGRWKQAGEQVCANSDGSASSGKSDGKAVPGKRDDNASTGKTEGKAIARKTRKGKKHHTPLPASSDARK